MVDKHFVEQILLIWLDRLVIQRENVQMCPILQCQHINTDHSVTFWLFTGLPDLFAVDKKQEICEQMHVLD